MPRVGETIQEPPETQPITNQPMPVIVFIVRALFALRSLTASRAVMAGMTILGTVVYVWNAPHVVDFPEYDESFYFFRGVELLKGSIVAADFLNPGNSPLYITVYSFWYALLRQVDLYPYVYLTSVFVLALGAYFLLSRLLPPMLSWVMSLLIVAWSVPFPPTALYIFATGALWLALAVIGQHIWQRALASFLVLLCILLRPDFAPCAALLIILLCGYDARRWLQGKLEWRALATSYAPAVLTLALLGAVFFSSPEASGGRISFSIPFSYSEYYSVEYPSQFDPHYDLTDVWRLFQRDFGIVPQPRTTLQTIGAMTHNPRMLSQYLAFNSERLVASYGTAVLDGRSWQADTFLGQIPVLPTDRNTWGFMALVLCFTIVAAAARVYLSRRGILSGPDLSTRIPNLLGCLSLSALLPLLILVNPYQRFFMLYPLFLVPAGFGVLWIYSALKDLSHRLAFPAAPSHVVRLAAYAGLSVSLVIVTLGTLPQPYLHNPSNYPIAETLAFLKANVSPGSTVVGEPADSYANYLIADGDNVIGLQASQYPSSVIVNVIATHPDLDNLYVLFNRIFPYSPDSQWVTGWNSIYPQIPLSMVAQEPAFQLTLLKLPSDIGRRVAYLNLVQEFQQAGLLTGNVPTYSEIDFSSQVDWQSYDPQNNLQSKYQPAWGYDLASIIMHPNAPGVDPTVPHLMTTSLPPTWSGGTLLFAATLAPWAANQLGAHGVQFVFSIPGTSYSQTFQVPNSYPDEHWVPMALRLPRFSSSTTLQVTILPRTSLLFDTTFLSFVGFAASKASGTPA